MKEFLEFLVKAIVKNESEVVVEEIIDEASGILLKLKVAQEDMGIIIGKEGRTIKGLRNLLKAKAIKEDQRVNIVLLDEGNIHPEQE
ncbi:MAG: KH domain-containing protein [Patescibacteria group bacterium]